MNEICTEIEIHAPAERVWEVLTDFPAYCHWNPVLCPVRGEAKPRGQLRVRVRPVNGLGVTFRATVLRAEVPHELCWSAKLVHRLLFAGKHSFAIEPTGNGTVRFVQREVYTGVLAPLILLVLASRNRRAFEEMNRALKARAEQLP